MKIRQYIKRMATLALMVAILVLPTGAWGQVKGDKYETSVIENITYYATVDDGSTAVLQKAFDGDKETWWDAARSGQRMITIDFGRTQTLARIRYYGGGGTTNTSLRPTKVQVYASSNGSYWQEVYTFDKIDRTIREMTLDIPQSSRKSARYFRFVLVPGLTNEGTYQTLAMNEIWLYSVKGNNYEEINVPSPVVSTTYVGDKTIKHKPAKWHGMRSGGNFVDTFDDTQYFTSGDGSTQIQAAHTYVDTLYVKKGSPIQLLLPTLFEEATDASNSAPKYQRWYNYETEGTFPTRATGDDNIIDLLTPPDGVAAYRFQNGYVAGNGLFWASSAMSGANFYYPADGEDHYVVACDISGYTDFTEEFSSGQGGTFGANGEYIEPTLSLRVLYVLVGIYYWCDKIALVLNIIK